jgi:hypothetical protein
MVTNLMVSCILTEEMINLTIFHVRVLYVFVFQVAFKYKRKTSLPSEEALKRCLKAIHDDKISIRKAGRHFGICENRIRRYLKNFHSGKPQQCLNFELLVSIFR